MTLHFSRTRTKSEGLGLERVGDGAGLVVHVSDVVAKTVTEIFGMRASLALWLLGP